MSEEFTDQPVKMADEVAERVAAALLPRFDAIDAHFGAIDARFGAIDARFDAIDARFDAVETKIEFSRDELKGEAQAIRQVVDTLASQEDFAGLDRKVSSVSADTQATRQATQDVKAEVSRLRADVKTAGIPVR